MTDDSNTRTPTTDRHEDWVRCNADRFWRDFGALEKAGEIHKVDPSWLVAAIRAEAQQLENRVHDAETYHLRLYGDLYQHSWENDRQSIDRLTMLAEALGQVVEAKTAEAMTNRPGPDFRGGPDDDIPY